MLKFISFLWGHLCFAIRQILLFVKHIAIVLGIIGTIVAVLNGPGFAQSSRNDLEEKLDRAFSQEWRNNEVLNVHFKVEKALLFNEEAIKEKVKNRVENWNTRVKNDLESQRVGIAIGNLPLHKVRAFYSKRLY